MEEQRWLIHQAMTSPDRGADPGKQILADVLARLRGHLLPAFSDSRVGRLINQGLYIQALIPDVQRAPLRVAAQVFPIPAHALGRGVAGLPLGMASRARGHNETDREAL